MTTPLDRANQIIVDSLHAAGFDNEKSVPLVELSIHDLQQKIAAELAGAAQLREGIDQLIKELAMWEVRGFSQTGRDVFNVMIELGLATKAAVAEAMAEAQRGLDPDHPEGHPA